MPPHGAPALRAVVGATALACVVALLAAVGAAGSVVAGSAAAAAPEPGPVIGGPLHAEMYPSGVETAPDGTVVVADTGNNRIARYRPGGGLVWSVGSHGADRLEFDNPRDVGVDAADNVYVADTRNSRIVKLSSSGAWLDSTTGPSTAFSFPLGVTVKGDRVYVGDTGRDRVVVLDLDLEVVRTITGTGACAIQGNRDATADAAGNVYVAGYQTNQVVVFSPTGACLRTWGGTGSGAGQFRTPYGVATHVDPVTGRELVYVADGLNNRAQVFTLTGGFVAQFGGYGEPDEPGTLTTMRRVAVDGDGNVWAADLWGERIARWDRNDTGFDYDRAIGEVQPPATSDSVFHEARGMAFAPDGDLWVADTVHHGFRRFDTGTGRLVDTCGIRAAEGSRLGQFNWPRGIAVDPATGNLWAADTKQHQLQVLTPDCEGIGFVRNATAGTDERSFNWPYDIAIRPSDRWAFVVDTQNHRIKAYDVAGAVFPSDNKGPLPAFVLGSRGVGDSSFRWPSGVAVGPSGTVFVADRGNDRVQELRFDPDIGFTFLRTWDADGTLDQPEGVAVDPTGRVVVADSADDEMVVLAPGDDVEATVGGLHHPSAVEVGPDGRIYVADTYGDVVRTYTMGAGPTPDTVAPTGAYAAPAAGSSVPVGATTITGTAADDRSVAAVRVALRRDDADTWLRANGTWGAFQWLPATLDDAGAPETAWSLPVTLPVPAGYFAMLRVEDAAANQNDVPRPFLRFTATASDVDTARPTGVVTRPRHRAERTAPLTIRGTASDDVAVAGVRLGIRNVATGRWWTGSRWQAQPTKVAAALAAPGERSTAWSYTLAPAPGDYGFSSTISDTAGKRASGSGKPPWRRFTITRG